MYYVLKKINRSWGVSLVLLMSVLVLSIGFAAAQSTQQPDTTPSVPQGVPDSLAYLYGDAPAAADIDYLTRIAEEEGSVRVMVKFNTQLKGLVPYEMLGITGQRQVVETVTERVLALPEIANAQNVRTFTDLPMMALTVDAEGLQALLEDDQIVSVAQDRFRRASLDQSTLTIGAAGANGAWSLGYTGAGQTVAVLDSGVDKAHPFLSGKVVSEACYNSAGNFGDETTPVIVSSTCPDSVLESTAVDSGVPCNVPGGECVHGTHIAGVAAGKGESFNGVAPDANVISIKVTSRVDSIICGQSTTTCIFFIDSDVLKGLERVYQLRNSFTIAAVNLSFGGGLYNTEADCNTDPASANYSAAVQKLNNVGIAVVASSGNDGAASQMEFPACLPDVVSVAASGSAAGDNTIYSTSNTANFLDFVAPGYQITSAVPLGTPFAPFADASGTSVAAPHIVGAYALMRDYREGVALELIYEALRSTGDSIVRPGIGSYIRPHVGKAIQWLIVPETPELLSPADNAEFNEPGITFSWTSGTDTNNYRLKVFNAAGETVLNQNILHATCTDTCTYVLTTPLQDRQMHTWRVVAQNAQRDAPSLTRSFYVDYPGKPQLVSPVDDFNFNRPADFTEIVWNAVPAATQYRLIVRDRTVGGKIVNATLASTDCTEATCTYVVTPEQQAKLVDGHRYQWFVKASNDLGVSRSEKRFFTTQFPAPPVLVSPVDGFIAVGSSQVGTFQWLPVLDVPEYRIQIRDTKNGALILSNIVAAGTVCNESICTYTMTQPEKETMKGSRTYRWQVQSRNELGKSKSAKWKFTNNFPGKPVLQSPISGTVIHDPSEFNLLQWTEVLDVTNYRIFIRNKTAGVVVHKVNVTVGSEVNCVAGICSYIPTPTDQSVLKDRKTYQWYVQARTPYGNTKSTKNMFTTSMPGKIQALTPIDDTRLNSREELTTMTWGANVYTDGYRLSVKDTQSGKIIFKVNLPTDNSNPVCDANTCTYTVPQTLRDDLRNGRTYKWWVRIANTYGKYNSNKLDFRTRF